MLRGHDQDGRAITDVASIQKSEASVLAGMAQAQGLLRLDDAVSHSLGAGWSKAPRDQEARITLRHLMTMTSGLSNELSYEADAGSKWHYNEAGFECALKAIATAAKTTPADLARKWLTSRVGMNDSGWVRRPDGRDEPGGKAIGFATTPRDLARFGLLILAGGQWKGERIIDREYLRLALRPSQKLNPSYGYFWWLNGQERMINAGDRPRDGAWIPTAPPDLVGAIGGGERRVYIVPSLELVVTRLGDKIGTATFDTDFWKLLSAAAPKPPPTAERPDGR
jgi:CubicO group peptidase (beta-lactamase class C family)